MLPPKNELHFKKTWRVFGYSKCHSRQFLLVGLLSGLLPHFLGCSISDQNADGKFGQVSSDSSNLHGKIIVEGSSTVEPIMIKTSEKFTSFHPKVSISISSKGTSNGLLSLANNEVDIANISREIKQDERLLMEKNEVEFIEIPIAYDGLTIVVNQANEFIDSLNLEQLKIIFRSDLAARTWRDVDPSWPNQKITVYAAGISSGTHDFMAGIIREDTDFGIRSDDCIIFSEDDLLLVRGIRDDSYAIGFFGFHYYKPESNSLRAVKIVNHLNRPIAPTPTSILSGEYHPFRRTLSFCVNRESFNRLEVREFIFFLLRNGSQLVHQAGYVPLKEESYRNSLQLMDIRKEFRWSEKDR